MTRLFALAIALLVCAIGLEAALLAAGYLAPWLQSHMVARWFVPACNVFAFGCLGSRACVTKKLRWPTMTG